ncbi:MAG: hypothetical protein ACRYG8_52985 [Janthinobacterium lividum]
MLSPRLDAPPLPTLRHLHELDPNPPGRQNPGLSAGLAQQHLVGRAQWRRPVGKMPAPPYINTKPALQAPRPDHRKEQRQARFA